MARASKKKAKANRKKAPAVILFSPSAAHLTISQAATRHNVAPYFIRQAIISGSLKAVTAGRRYVIPVTALNEFFTALAG